MCDRCRHLMRRRVAAIRQLSVRNKRVADSDSSETQNSDRGNNSTVEHNGWNVSPVRRPTCGAEPTCDAPVGQASLGHHLIPLIGHERHRPGRHRIMSGMNYRLIPPLIPRLILHVHGRRSEPILLLVWARVTHLVPRTRTSPRYSFRVNLRGSATVPRTARKSDSIAARRARGMNNLERRHRRPEIAGQVAGSDDEY